VILGTWHTCYGVDRHLDAISGRLCSLMGWVSCFYALPSSTFIYPLAFLLHFALYSCSVFVLAPLPIAARCCFEFEGHGLVDLDGQTMRRSFRGRVLNQPTNQPTNHAGKPARGSKWLWLRTRLLEALECYAISGSYLFLPSHPTTDMEDCV
jgi:hypothetical protein